MQLAPPMQSPGEGCDKGTASSHPTIARAKNRLAPHPIMYNDIYYQRINYRGKVLHMFSELFVREIIFEPDVKKCKSYIASLALIRKVPSIKLSKQVTFFVGENGTGKSTLLEAVAVAAGFNAEGGSRNFNFSTYQSHSDLYQYIRLSKGIKRPKDGFFLRAESFYNVASEIEELDRQSGGPSLKDSYGGKSLHEQSHGESFLALVLNRLNGNGLYIFDEPEAALSPSRQLALLARINQLVSENSQFIIATHSPILMAYPDADIYLLDENGIQLISYKQTEHYLLTKQFLDDPEKMMRYLFEK